MFLLKHLTLCLLWYIFCVLQPINAHSLGDLSMRNEISKEYELLKAANENLKLRLEIMELKNGAERQDHRVTKIEYKLQAIAENLDRIDRTLASMHGQDQSKESTVKSMSKKPESAIAAENLQTKLGNLEANESSQSDEVLQNVDEIPTPIWNADNGDTNEPKLCVKNEQQKIICSNITLPNSCSSSNTMNCYKNQCRIQNHLFGPNSFVVPCDFTIDGGGWTIIQRRVNSSVDFYRNWSDYKTGFGDLDGNYWIGLEKLYALTTVLEPVELRIQLQDWDGVVKYAKYDAFEIGNERTKYTLKSLGQYSGDAGDSLKRHLNSKFATKDQDNAVKCAQDRHGAWWYEDCFDSNLNGRYLGNPENNSQLWVMSWNTFHNHLYSLKSVQMMIRPRNM